MSACASNSAKRKRKREGKRRSEDDKLRREYSGISFSTLPSTGRPGTPHRYFDSSYVTSSSSSQKSSSDATTEDNNAEYSVPLHVAGQVVHRHANGLCIVTAGELVKKACEVSRHVNEEEVNDSTSIHATKVEYLIKATESQTVGAKRRKKMGKNRKGSNNNKSESSGVVGPSDTLARVTLSNGSIVELDCCVFGMILEINTNLPEKPSLLMDDPFLDGYLAVIMPQGPFPFPPPPPP